MLCVPGYEILEQLHSGSRAVVYRARRERDQLQVVLKAPRHPRPEPAEVARLQAEYRIGSSLEHPAVVRYLGLERDEHRPVLVIEDFGGAALARQIADGPLDLPRFLEIAVTLAEGLAAIHRRGVVHRDINPANIIYEPRSGRVKIADLGIAALLAHSGGGSPTTTRQLEGTLRYLSPEQTGRVNRSVDQRADLYSFGVTCYELLAGQVPFDAVDPLELIHAHLARTPPSLASVAPDVPEVLATIVTRLLAKNVEERYQSAEGLAADLRRCRATLTPAGAIPPFPLGEDDVSSRFALPEKLYGRADALEQLQAAFERARDGGRVWLAVSGRSGSGKTALLRELERPVLQRSALFVHGSFDAQQADTPRSALVEIGAELVRQVLAGPEERVVAFREQLQRAVGEAGHVLIDALPEVELLIGPQPPAPELPEREAEPRFNRLACAFFRVFAGRRHPLVVVLDDLQWADAATLKLIELLMADRELHHLLLVGCFDAEKLTPSHPLSLTLEAVARGPAASERIELAPLTTQQIAELLADALGTPPDAVGSFAALLREKTLGNPLFLAQLLQSLHAEELLRFDAEARAWRWDERGIAAREISDDVAELLLARMNRLPPATREAVELASCIGGSFDLGTLAALAQLPLERVAEAVLPAVEGGVLRPCCGGFGRLAAALAGDDDASLGRAAAPVRCEFAHGRFQQAAYARMPMARRRELHLRLGRMLRGELSTEAQQERIFELVRHFEAGLEVLDDPQERLAVARLCLAAGEKALAAVAHSAALHHFRAGVSLLPEDRWERHYELTFSLTEPLYRVLVNTRAPHEQSLPLGRELLERAASRTHRLLVLSSHVVELALMRRTEEALERGAAALREFDLELLPDDVPQAIERTHSALEHLLGERELSDLAELPAMTDPEMLAAQQLLGALSLPIYMRRRDLLPLQASASVRLALAHGNAPASAVAYCTWGKVLAHNFGQYSRGYQLCRIGRRLADSTGAFRAGARVVAMMVAWVREPLRDVIEELRHTYRLGIETGEQNFAGISAAMIPAVGFSAGLPLEDLERELRGYVDFISAHQGDVGVREIDLTLRLIAVLRGERPLETAFFDSDQQTEAALEVIRVRNAEAVVWYHLQRARLELLLGDARAAAAEAALAAPYVDWSMGAFASYDLEFAAAVAAARVLDGLADDGRASAQRERLARHASRLQGWVDAGAGVNLRHKALIIAAELCRAAGDHAEIGPAYEHAIAAAAASEQIQDQALANELAARHYAAAGLPKIARVYLQEAYYCYRKWGATVKLQAMEREHPFLAEPEPRAAGTSYGTAPSSVTTAGASDASPALDYATIIEASRTISKEVVLANLLRQLLAIAAENAGARLAYLLLRRDGTLCVEAAWRPAADTVQLIDSVPVDAFDEVSVGVANYVARTGEVVALDDAARAGRFQSDPTITRRRSRSLLCAPLANQGRLVGLLYLENNLVAGAFTPARVELVGLLCGQAAISIDNATLYAELEQKVEARTRDLAHKNEQLAESLARQRQMQQQLLVSEKMASLGNLVAGVAHELNTPIGAVVASADTAARAVDRLRELSGDDHRVAPPEQAARLFALLRESHRVIRSAGERVSEIVRTLRSFARLDEAERKPADLHQGLDSTLDLLRHRLQRGIDVIKEYGQLPEVLCYPNQLNQVFMNLLVNAIDALTLRDDGVVGGTIQIGTWLADGVAHVAISDDGPGIPSADLERIFDPGFTTKGVRVGTGLGLSICFSIVEQHGGTIAVDSAPGRGATFTVEIPVS